MCCAVLCAIDLNIVGCIDVGVVGGPGFGGRWCRTAGMTAVSRTEVS